MQRFSAVIVTVVAAVLALGSIGCVDEAKYNAVLLRNREQEKLLQEKEADLARLGERVQALQARTEDAQRILQEKEDHLSSVMQERDEVRKAFDELKDAYTKLAGRSWGGGGKLPEEVALSIQQLADQYPELFQFDAATGRLRFASDITFDFASIQVKPNARTAISQLGRILASDAAKAVKASIVGHTDSVPVAKAATKTMLKNLGKAASNQGLSEARAEAVADILTGAGVPAGRITTRGFGASQPIASNDSKSGQAKNRRVEIFLST
ncbi:MAG: OmpA family protein [Planctomycetota bacterium]|nr:OmpA family protein [Planctomycetota bacterium]